MKSLTRTLWQAVDLLDVVIELALGRTPPTEVCDTGVRSAAVKLLLPSRVGRIAEVRGLNTVSELPNVVDLSLKAVVGTHVEPPSMNAYLGHVVVVDRIGHGARAQAEWAAGQIELVYEVAERDIATDLTADGTASTGTPVPVGVGVSP